MRNSILISLSLVLVSVASLVHADNVYMLVKASKQGDIKGDVTLKGREGAIECLELSFEVASPRDAASGMATGKRQYAPLRCVKRIDRSTPLLFGALIGNEPLPTVTISAWGTTSKGTGQQTQTYTLALKQAFVTGQRQFIDAKGALHEEITISFGSVAVTWNDGGITAEDNVRQAK